MKSVRVRYFASLREQSQCESEQVEVICQTYGELYSQLAKRHGFDLPTEMIQVAVNDEFSNLDAKIESGSTVVFIPPVAGG